jgi:Holliday junction resolvasome RuvABC DNA-binding subunit
MAEGHSLGIPPGNRGPVLNKRSESKGAGSDAPGSPGRLHRNLNQRIARRLEEVAQLLEAQAGNLYRVQAYRRAAETLRRLPRSAAEIVQREGEPGLRRLPGIGESLARSIATLVLTGKLPMLHRLRGESEAGLLLASVPGIGKRMAERLHQDLGIHSLEELEAAAHDGRLEKIAGIGHKRLAAITDSLSARLGRVRPLRAIRKTAEPAVAEILDVDREYREKAARGALRTIAPRRFNPNHEAWLPILHAVRGERHYMALFSNTAHAHEMGMTKDWVVLYYDGRNGERQCTVITSQRGPLTGKRIVGGREVECLDYYDDTESAAAPAAGDLEREPALGRVAPR